MSDNFRPKYSFDRTGIPDWAELGVKVRAGNERYNMQPGRLLGVDLSDGGVIFCVELLANCVAWTWFRYAEPIALWEPKTGEYVAVWDDGDDAFEIRKFAYRDGPCFRTNIGVLYARIARITDPTVDLACDVEEIKRRTDWL